MLELLLAVGVATLVSAFCSVSEAALYSIPWSRIEDLRRQGKKSGERLYALRQDVERPITAILTLNTIANTAGASVAGAAAVAVYGEGSLPFFALVFTGIILIFAEILPKTAGVVYARTITPYLAGPISWLVALLTPLIWSLGFVARLMKSGGGPEATEDDIRAMASLSRKAGGIKPYEEVAIRNILSLDLKTVEEVMTPRTVVFSLPASMDVLQARESRGLWPHSRVPVYDDDDRENIVGLVYRRDVLRALASDQDDLTLGQMMKPVEFVPETLPLDALLHRFLSSRTHLFVVLDEYGGLAGVVSLEDIVEEILGKEIVDETDQVADLRAVAHARRELIARRAAPRAADSQGFADGESGANPDAERNAAEKNTKGPQGG